MRKKGKKSNQELDITVTLGDRTLFSMRIDPARYGLTADQFREQVVITIDDQEEGDGS